jgi:septum formation protein
LSRPALVLASASPRRRELLSQLGIPLTVRVAEVDESPWSDEPPREHTMRLAQDKAAKIAAQVPDEWVLGADTVVVIDNRILGKPNDRDEAFAMLRAISGRWHTVYTGYCLMHHGRGVRHTGAAESKVFIRQLSDEQIHAYIATGEPMDKAGAYAIQGIGAALVQQVRGSYTNVVGLPLAEVAELWERIHGPGVLFGDTR